MVIKPGKIKAFEEWHNEVKQILAKQEGYLSTELIRPSDKQTAPEYFILVRFKSMKALDAWKHSTAFSSVKEKSKEFVINTMVGERQTGVEMFFSRPLNNIYYPKPPLWKQIIAGTLAIYPIILVSNMVFGPLVSGIKPPQLAMFVSLILSAPLFIFILPIISGLFKNWLYPKERD